ncbi:MAG TPA: NAD(P)-dependent oxidoreductase [Acidimicrobiales bacterium]|nr:NAD(P)-dependent oxidoreductase [Acidimicrobiales bacterium]
MDNEGRHEAVAVHAGRFGDAMIDRLRLMLPGVDLVAAASPEAVARADVLVALVDDAPAIADALHPGIDWVHVLGAGIDGFPLDIVGERTLTCSRGAGAPAIAEFVLAAMLAFEKRLPESWITGPPGQWSTANLGGLAGRTLGVVGLGSIGAEVATRALAFDMQVVAFRRSQRPSPISGVTLSPSLVSVLAGSDHVVVAAPATAETQQLIGESALAEIKPGAHFINVSRGSLVDQDALVRALDDGRIATASLDVVDPEPLPAGHPLYRHPRVRLSPHISWSSPQTVPRTFQLFADNLVRYRAGQPLLGQVDVAAGY